MNEETKSWNRYFIQIKKVWEKPTVRKFSAATATLMAIAFFLLVALKPTIETIFSLNKKIQDLSEIEQMMTKKIGDINLAINTYQQVQNDLPAIETYYPKNPEAEKVIAILETNSKKSGVAKPNFTISSYPFSGGKGLYSFTFSTENSYPNILNFIQNIHDSNRLINIMGFSLGELKDKGNISLSINSDVYYEKR
jgi:hypothetical protein